MLDNSKEDGRERWTRRRSRDKRPSPGWRGKAEPFTATPGALMGGLRGPGDQRRTSPTCRCMAVRHVPLQNLRAATWLHFSTITFFHKQTRMVGPRRCLLLGRPRRRRDSTNHVGAHSIATTQPQDSGQAGDERRGMRPIRTSERNETA